MDHLESANQRLASLIGTLMWFVSSFILWETLGDFVSKLFRSQFAAYTACGIIGGILGAIATEIAIKLLDTLRPSHRLK